ncbi:MAG: head-tail connector protein [Xanthobacteraceae bacterium]|nr:head-tail connector protein [Xanthobacteraceae bacterium]
MSAILLTGPASEPLSLTEAKDFLRVEHDDDDSVIAALIGAARNHVEALTRLGLMMQTWRIVLDRWPEQGRIKPRLGPLQSLAAARVYNEANVASVVDTGRFVIDRAAGTIAAPCWSLPPPGRAVAGIELDVAIGFGAASTDMPQVLLQAIRMLVAHWYENRSLVTIGSSVAMLPPSVNAMISSYRVMSL